ncbi:MAG: FkbM family methyltransferase [Candidatus Paceibacterota bacterium]
MKKKIKFYLKNILLNFKKLVNKIRHPYSFSQYNQDIICFKRYLSNISQGTFVEVGADDGISKSNTYFYELRGWKGLCIEPSPKRFKLLDKNRDCVCENYAITESERSVEFMDVSGYGKGLSGIVDEYDKRHKKRIKEEIKHPSNKGYEVVKVKTIPLKKLLKKHNINHVNFCTIDVEGAELSVLKSIDFNDCIFDVILVENNYKEDFIESYMLEKGFLKEESIVQDDVYVRKGFLK